MGTWSHRQTDGPDVVVELDVTVGDSDAHVEVHLAFLGSIL